MSEINTVITGFHIEWVVYFFALLFCFKRVLEIIDWWMVKLGIETKWTRERHASERLIEKHEEQIDVHSECLTELSTKVDHLTELINEMQRKDEERDKKNVETLSANLKDRIGQSYRYYNKRKFWSEMERDAFNSLLHQYEELGNKNSFVHTICEPASLTWEIREEEE